MTFPGASVMEWTVYCGRDSATAKGNSVVIDITYLELGPEIEKRPSILKGLLFSLLLLAKRSRVNGIAIVLGHYVPDMSQVLLLDRLKPPVDEFDLRGVRAFWVGHWDGAIEGELPGDPEAT